jgi:hypothetical protein
MLRLLKKLQRPKRNTVIGLRNSICLIFIVLLSSCGLPAPFLYLSSIKSGYDTIQTIRDEKTTNDEIISTIINEDCKTSNIFSGNDYCNVIIINSYE